MSYGLSEISDAAVGSVCSCGSPVGGSYLPCGLPAVDFIEFEGDNGYRSRGSYCSVHSATALEAMYAAQAREAQWAAEAAQVKAEEYAEEVRLGLLYGGPETEDWHGPDEDSL